MLNTRINKYNFKSELIASQKGFTLAELLIASALSIFIISALSVFFLAQQNAYSIQDQVAEMQQNARVAIDVLTRDIRMAGYDPANSDKFGFTDSTFKDSNNSTLAITTNTEAYLTVDDDGDGTIDTNTAERIGYKIDSGNLKIGTTITGTTISAWTPVAENITTLTFTYAYAVAAASGLPSNSDADADNDLEDIRTVQISLTARTSKEDSGYTTGYNLTGTSADGTCRTRTLTANVRVMNLGL